MAGHEKRREERLKKQRQYQREYRRRMKVSKAPDRDIIAQAFLYHAVMGSIGRPRAEQRLMQVLDEVEARLVAMGFDHQQTRAAINDLIDRYEAGWTFQRKVHLLPKADTVSDEDDDSIDG